LSKFAAFALSLRGNARAAVPWTFGEPLGLKEKADYYVLTEPQHLEMVRAGDIYKPVVIRDPPFDNGDLYLVGTSF
jgi:hypothetical protein